jgi:hypothetical protein
LRGPTRARLRVRRAGGRSARARAAAAPPALGAVPPHTPRAPLCRRHLPAAHHVSGPVPVQAATRALYLGDVPPKHFRRRQPLPGHSAGHVEARVHGGLHPDVTTGPPGRAGTRVAAAAPPAAPFISPSPSPSLPLAVFPSSFFPCATKTPSARAAPTPRPPRAPPCAWQSLLCDPHLPPPANPEAAQMLSKTPKEYKRRVRKLAEKSCV